MELHRLTLSQMLTAIEARQCVPLDIVESCLGRIAETEPAIGAWAHLEGRQRWIERWQANASVSHNLPFKGLPLGVKDTIDVANLPAERGSSIWAGRVASEDAACVARLAAAGLHVAGKTVTTEFAYFTPGKTANPYHTGHTPGGSSSGSAAAVGASMVPVALGSQTAASVIRPASFCGVAAYVASVGLFSLRGVTPLAWSFDAPGVLARCVEDLERVYGALAAQPIPALGMVTAPSALLAFDGRAFGDVETAMLDAYESALRDLTARGVRIVRPNSAHAGAEWPRLHHRLMAFEAAQSLAAEWRQSPQGLSAPLRALLEEGHDITLDERVELLEQRKRCLADLETHRSGCDAIIAPAAPGAAPLGLGATGAPHLSRPWQLFGLPQVAMPFAHDASGLPLGIQLIGPMNEDRALLKMARWLEREMGWSHVPPAI